MGQPVHAWPISQSQQLAQFDVKLLNDAQKNSLHKIQLPQHINL